MCSVNVTKLHRGSNGNSTKCGWIFVTRVWPILVTYVGCFSNIQNHNSCTNWQPDRVPGGSGRPTSLLHSRRQSLIFVFPEYAPSNYHAIDYRFEPVDENAVVTVSWILIRSNPNSVALVSIPSPDHELFLNHTAVHRVSHNYGLRKYHSFIAHSEDILSYMRDFFQ